MTTANEQSLAIKRDEHDRDMFRLIELCSIGTQQRRQYINEWATVMVDGLPILFGNKAESVLRKMKPGEARTMCLTIEVGDIVAILKAQ